jgi:myosin heavy subunit
MAKNDLFRVSLIGGYNKTDVEEYVKNMENEIESVKVMCKKEKNDLIRRIDNNEEASVLQKELLEKDLQEAQEKLKVETQELQETKEELRIRTQELQETKEELRIRTQELQKAEKELSARTQELQELQEELKARTQELQEELRVRTQELQEELRGRTQELQEEQEQKTQESLDADHLWEAGTDQAADTTETDALLLENKMLKQELQEKSEELLILQQQYKQLKTENQDEGFLDRNTIAEIMRDARENAKLIKEETMKERDRMLEAARTEAEKLKSDLLLQMNSELEDKGIQLIAAKYKIIQYIKEVKFAEEGLYNIHSRMNNLVESMTARLDNYWDGEKYKILEDTLRESENVHKEGK